VPLAVKASAEDYVPQTVVETSFNDLISDVVFISNPAAQINAFVGNNFETTAAETPLDEIEYKTIEPPEDGWTLELLNEVTYINGKDIDLPFSIDDLGEGYAFKEYFRSEDAQYGYISGDLIFEKQAIGYIDYSYPIPNDKIDSSKITTFAFSERYLDFEEIRYNQFSINGIQLGSSMGDMIAKLGKCDRISSDEVNFLYYLSDINGYFHLCFDRNDNSVTGFYISIGDSEENE
jgi:hypothetical protein